MLRASRWRVAGRSQSLQEEKMKKFMLSIAGFLLVSAAPSFGTMVSFNTVSSTLCAGNVSCGVQLQSIGGVNGVTLTYKPNLGATLNANPIASGTFGEIWLQCNDGSINCASVNLTPVGLVLNIIFTQTSPDPASGTVSTTSITGTIGGNSGLATIAWSMPSVQIGTAPVTYTVVNSPLNIVSPSNSNEQGTSPLGPPGKTTIQGTVSTVPEPGTYALIGGALFGLGMLRRKR